VEKAPPSPTQALEDLDVVLRDGSTVRVSAAVQGDRVALPKFLQRFPKSHAYSGFSPRSRPPSWAAERFVEVDNHHRHSLVALSGQDGKIVGHGYYALDKPGVAEVALPVADSMQGTRHHPASGTWQPPPRQPGSRRLRAT